MAKKEFTNNTNKGAKLKVLSLGKWSDVNQNMFVYETEKDILILDCGVGFPTETNSQIDVLIPDISYLRGKKDKIRGVVISHGHLDHYGALPYILPEIGFPPIWANRLVKGFIEAELAEFNLPKLEIREIRPDHGTFRIGSFEVSPFRVNHSVPDSLGFCFKTSVGKVFHVSDFKFDLTPVDGKVFQINRAARLAHPEVLALFTDCLGAVYPGFTSSEKEIEKIFDQIVSKARHQVFITTLSSNISRFQQAIRVSLNHGRKIVLLGYSVEEKIKIAQKLGYLKLNSRDVVLSRKARRMPQDKLTYLISGSYGQPGSALGRLGGGKLRDVKIEKDAIVVFSADPAPPGTREMVDVLVDKLTLKGAKVHYYEIQENLHVSGHGSANDIRLLLAITQPKFCIPIGGNPRHIRAFSSLAQEMGVPPNQILELFEGEVIQLSEDKAAVVDTIKINQTGLKKR